MKGNFSKPVGKQCGKNAFKQQQQKNTKKKKRKPLIFHLFSKNSAPLWGNFLRFWLKCLGVRFNFILYISIFGVYFVHFRLFSPPPAQTRPYTPKSPPPKWGQNPQFWGPPSPSFTHLKMGQNLSILGFLQLPQNRTKPHDFRVPPLLQTPQNGAKPLNFGVPQPPQNGAKLHNFGVPHSPPFKHLKMGQNPTILGSPSLPPSNIPLSKCASFYLKPT